MFFKVKKKSLLRLNHSEKSKTIIDQSRWFFLDQKRFRERNNLINFNH